ncbi:DUF5797 family protein [Halobium salinum]|uniref:DUF5797 family protein n=1 Tax=Halobium salinum TaxID=1364940 RepID=A0ABD5P6B1_9EURY|nr:DUF5797 family protein [Halobium salinum]
MSLTDEEKERLADVVRLQPTKNKELQDKWGLESGSEVHQYLENHLKDYYFRDDNSLIRATTEGAELVGIEPAVESEEAREAVDEVPDVIRVPELQAQAFRVLAGPDDRSESVVSVLNKLREEYDVDPEAGDVRSALQSLRRKNVVEVIYRTVPTFRRVVELDEVEVEVVE